MAKLTIKQLECKTNYYVNWFFISARSNHGRDCAIGTLLCKDGKVPVVLTPQSLALVDIDGRREFTFGVPSDFVSLDLHKVTPSEYKLEYLNMLNFLLSCNLKQLAFVKKRWSDRTRIALDIVDEYVDDMIWPYMNR